MRDFSKVSPSLWHSDRFNNLPSDDGRYTYLYLLTCEHQTSAGAYRLPDAYAAADLNWPVERYRKARAELVAADLVKFDSAASVVMITRWFKFNPPMNTSHLKGILHTLHRLPSDVIRGESVAELEAIQAAADAAKAAAAEGKPGAEKKPAKDWSNWRPRS